MVDENVSRKRANAEGAQYAVIFIAILRPDHLVLHNKLTPCLLVAIIIGADTEDHEIALFRVTLVKVANLRNGLDTGWTPRAPKIYEHNLAAKIFERDVLAF